MTSISRRNASIDDEDARDQFTSVDTHTTELHDSSAFLDMDDVIQIDDDSVDNSTNGSIRGNEHGEGETSLDGILTDNNSSQSSRKSHRSSKRTDKILREELQFMNDFDPTKRIEQKKKKRYTLDAMGRPQFIAHNFDICDCLIADCPGCHYPCKRCGDRRCGHECRQNRRWLYDSIEVEGRDNDHAERKNPNLNPNAE